jgi:hypothetical protein
MLGLRMPDGVHGRDLSIALTDGGPVAGIPDAVYIEGRLGSAQEWRAVRTASHMLAVDRDGSPVQLYDMRADPLQLHNLAAEAAAAGVRAELRDTLRRLARETGDHAF